MSDELCTVLPGASFDPMIQSPLGAPCTLLLSKAFSTVDVSGPVAVMKIMGRCVLKVPDEFWNNIISNYHANKLKLLLILRFSI